jgi:hypothetical protein
MAKTNYFEINIKAATITGAVVGFLAWLIMFPWYSMAGFGSYGMMGYMMGYFYTVFSPLSVIVSMICGAIAGVIIAVVYNWALKF